MSLCQDIVFVDDGLVILWTNKYKGLISELPMRRSFVLQRFESEFIAWSYFREENCDVHIYSDYSE